MITLKPGESIQLEPITATVPAIVPGYYEIVFQIKWEEFPVDEPEPQPVIVQTEPPE